MIRLLSVLVLGFALIQAPIVRAEDAAPAAAAVQAEDAGHADVAKDGDCEHCKGDKNADCTCKKKDCKSCKGKKECKDCDMKKHKNHKKHGQNKSESPRRGRI
jgi:hypothetical protein